MHEESEAPARHVLESCSHKWLGGVPETVTGSLPPEILAVALILTGVDQEGFTPVPAGRRQNLLSQLSDLFGCERRDIVKYMSVLCNSYSGV